MIKVLILFLTLLLSQVALAVCPGCPSGSNTAGTGAQTNLPGCRCNDGTYTWNGSYCQAPLSCPGGTSPSGAGGGASPAGCMCNNAGWAWNGSSCYIPDNCSAGSIRTNPANGGAEVCSGGSWVARTMYVYCTPPTEVKKGDDEWMTFWQTSYKTQNAPCDSTQRKDSQHADLNTPGSIRYDDKSKACNNTMNCISNSSPPSPGASCAGITIGWAANGVACYGNMPTLGSGGYTYAYDQTGPDMGWANFYCKDGVWSVTPGSCKSNSFTNCRTEYYYDSNDYAYYDYAYCGGSSKYIGYCCDKTDPYTPCDGYSSECP